MASKKGVSGFTNNMTKELINEQKKKEREVLKLEKYLWNIMLKVDIDIRLNVEEIKIMLKLYNLVYNLSTGIDDISQEIYLFIKEEIK